ncbi:hypothetical protein B1756_01680 [Natrarchaeobaculum aegyptiacum]|uniref:Uncharacterized protein n=1 Tax=Natrarchaeobaculum aegyptiacum TaxID=745377 RepID=A0A2Z2HNV8_9EURY|nr:hypothetical protein B1756_01680 [Natrarchaeobaculum aegyptiacum]
MVAFDRRNDVDDELASSPILAGAFSVVALDALESVRSTTQGANYGETHRSRTRVGDRKRNRIEPGRQ